MAASLTLEPMPVDLARSLAMGPPPAHPWGRWHPEYPMTDTAISVAMLLLAYDGVGPPPDEDLPPWWLYQIVVSGLVIGDISLRPLPEPVEGRTAVEIGYNVVPNWQGFGVATAACRLMLDLAWSHGADEVCAEASPYAPASRRVLAKVGFEPYDEDWFVIFRPATVEVDHG